MRRLAPQKPTATPQLDAEATFFVLRTPLLPVSCFLNLADGLTAHSSADEHLVEALRWDRRLVLERLATLYARPELAEALAIASPSLFEALSKAGQRLASDDRFADDVGGSLIRYLARMAFRCTPFGTFAGLSMGQVASSDDALRLVLSPQADYRKHARLDMYYLSALAEALCADPALRAKLTYRTNSGLYRAAGRLRYPQARTVPRSRTYALVGVEPSDYLERVLDCARKGAGISELTDVLMADPEITAAEAAEFINELIDEQLLVPEIEPPITGVEPIHSLLADLRPHPEAASTVDVLSRVVGKLASINEERLGTDPARYDEIGTMLAPLPIAVDRSRLIQVDLWKPSDAVLGAVVVAEVRTGVHLLARLDRGETVDPLKKFKEDFANRYENREVPLVEAIDEEAGVSFGPSAEPAPLLEGVAIGDRTDDVGQKWTYRDSYLQNKVEALPPDGVTPLVLDAADIEQLANRDPAPLPKAYSAAVTIEASSADAIRAGGEYRIYLLGAQGPSGVGMLGRFCHLSRELEDAVQQHVRTEEAFEPDAVFAEIVHLPEGRTGNVLYRPVLRSHEIKFLGRGGVPEDGELPITDLLVSVRSGRVVLRSRRLNRPVIPRLTSAHNPFFRGLGLYRFLGLLQRQDGRSVGFYWGPLEMRRYLPRVVHGRLVLALARWRFSATELARINVKSEVDRFKAVRELAEEFRLPRLFCVADADNVLLVDRHNPVSVETFVRLVGRRSQAILQEPFPNPDALCVTGPEGAFSNEIQIPFCAVDTAEPVPHLARTPTVRAGAEQIIRRSFEPGSECFYLKMYTGTATADQLLTDVVAPLVEDLQREETITHWYFIRYEDPDFHLRLRFFGAPHRLWTDLGTRLRAVSSPLLAEGRVWKIQVDTYEREVERYGGPRGIELSERLFHADSEACLALVSETSGPDGPQTRWRYTLMGMHALLQDFELSTQQMRDILAAVREQFGREFAVSAASEHSLGLRYRRERHALEELFDRAIASDSSLAAGADIMRRRSDRIRPLAKELVERERTQEMTASIQELLPSYLHMFANRMLRHTARKQELVLYDMLLRWLESRIARARRAAPVASA